MLLLFGYSNEPGYRSLWLLIWELFFTRDLTCCHHDFYITIVIHCCPCSLIEIPYQSDSIQKFRITPHRYPCSLSSFPNSNLSLKIIVRQVYKTEPPAWTESQLREINNPKRDSKIREEDGLASFSGYMLLRDTHSMLGFRQEFWRPQGFNWIDREEGCLIFTILTGLQNQFQMNQAL